MMMHRGYHVALMILLLVVSINEPIPVHAMRLRGKEGPPFEVTMPRPLSAITNNLLNCSELKTCMECTVSNNECGWCGGSVQKCLSGTASGPALSDGGSSNDLSPQQVQCPAEHWDFKGKHCSCSQFKTCGECFFNEYYNDCGWCATSNECMRAEFDKKRYTWVPRNGTCPKYEHPGRHDQSSSFYTSSCPIDQYCSTLLDWNECALKAEGDCAWCKSTQQCMYKHSRFKTTGCTEWEKDSWDPPCSGWQTCNDCTSSTGCGWCATTGVCMEGNSSGPSTPGTCPTAGEGGWLYGFSATCPPHCSQHKSCSSCTGSPIGETFAGCGWCSTTRSCHDGGVFGPSSGTCHLKDWRYAVCPCSDYQTCTTCLAARSDSSSNKPICGWCATTNNCIPGSYLGPNTTESCPGSTAVDWYFGTKNHCLVPNNYDMKRRHERH